jgi:glycosyltransferase involved in cell wall biosynthesis
MRKILLLNNGYPSATHPNYVTYIKSIKDCLIDAGFEVELLVLNSNFTTSAGKYFQFLKYYLSALFKRYGKYDYVYINNYPYSFLPLAIHFPWIKKVVIHWHGDDIFPGSKFAKLLNSFSYLFIGDEFLHLAPSSYFAREAGKTLNIDHKKIFVSPSGGVDTTVFVVNKKESVKRDVVRLGFASGLLQSKGIDLVLQLLHYMDALKGNLPYRIEFHFIYYGKEKVTYTEKLLALANTVKHQPFPIHEMVNFYKHIDILLFPSIRKAESLGLVSLEAMSCNIPVIATDAFAFQDTVINGVTGERFLMSDFAAFREAVERCIANLNQYQPRDFVVRNFSREAVVRGYQEILT